MMSRFIDREFTELPGTDTSEKKVFQALAPAVFKTQAAGTGSDISNLTIKVSPGKKHSSATLLRQKLNGHLVRELKDI